MGVKFNMRVNSHYNYQYLGDGLQVFINNALLFVLSDRSFLKVQLQPPPIPRVQAFHFFFYNSIFVWQFPKSFCHVMILPASDHDGASELLGNVIGFLSPGIYFFFMLRKISFRLSV